ncbi:glucosaminidase domain-containing protein [Aquisalimonas lutea]|uniref:glucosaminidase domain-containing protein n=1 Tax=Aquisalimonas lutea TaxID=1327750 RepID=UPI0025B5FA97|nr:glucosaminidase domain-containing protein [Aquisalimonas lutea]MDN3517314.1 glucosaminidase domain-containing protein [Aquisalimonas lutea]
MYQDIRSRLRNHRRTVAAGSGVAVVLAAVTTWTLLQGQTAPPPTSMLREDEELPEDIPELPADITYDERQDVLPPMVALDAETAAELDAAFETLGYSWPPAGEVPAVSVSAFPPLDDLSVDERKALFFRALLPMVLAENRIMRATRERVRMIFDQGEVAPESRQARLLETLADRFRVEGGINSEAFRTEMLRRIDVVPVSMALAQAANESGWGRSRFTREANNLFGIWTWREERGLKPEQRAADATHFVRIFRDLRASVRNYIYTINVGSAYDSLRRLRMRLRENGDGLSGLRLATGLVEYSERGEAYVEEIQGMIRSNGLHELGRLELVAVDAERLLEETGVND